MDGLISFVTLGIIGDGSIADNTQCATHTVNSYQEVQDDTSNATKVDIYSAAAGQKSQREAGMTTVRNYLQDTEQAAWMKAQVAVAEAYNNGSTKAEAKADARQAISDYYSLKQINIIRNWNSSISKWQYLRETATADAGIASTYVNFSHEMDYVYDGTGTSTVTLANGSTATFKTIRFHVSGSSGEVQIYGPAGAVSQAWPGEDLQYLAVKPPNDNYDTLVYQKYSRSGGPFTGPWNTIESQNTDLQNEAENFVNATWSDFDSGAINASDVISANTAMFEYGTAYNESGSMYDSVGALAIMGFDTPDLNNSGTMTVSYNGQNYTGIVMARNAPNGSWSVNQTYDPANITGPVFIATTEGNKVEFADPFTVTGMTSTDGEQMQSVNTTQYVYKTANTTQLNEMQDRLTALQAELREREQSAGSGFGSGGISPEAIGVILIAVAGIGAMSRRDQNRGGRGGSR